ncbi:MAG: matrixin family metalloprotease [Candidatus Pacearchaeota archaeon]
MIILIAINLFLFYFYINDSPSKVEGNIIRNYDNNTKIIDSLEKFIAKPKKINVYIDKLPYGIDEEAIESLKKAFVFWEEKGDVDFIEISNEEKANLRIQWVKEFGGEHIGYAYGGNFIELGLGDSKCYGRWKQYNGEVLFELSAHELGHILGYEHSSNKNDVMYPELKTKRKIDVEENNVLPERYTQYYPFCGVEEVNEYSIEINSNLPTNIYIVKSKEEYESFLNGEEFYHYPTCHESETESYSKKCKVYYGSGVIIENINPNPVQYSIKIKEI